MRCLNVLSLVYRRRGQVEEVQRYASRMQAMQAPEYLGVVKAHQAWIAWRAGTYAEVQEYSKEAFQLWERSPLVYYYQWTALWPMMGVALAEKRGADAVQYAGMLLDPEQQRLPDELTGLLEAAVQSGEANQPETAYSYLEQAIALAQKMGYL